MSKCSRNPLEALLILRKQVEGLPRFGIDQRANEVNPDLKVRHELAAFHPRPLLRVADQLYSVRQTSPLALMPCKISPSEHASKIPSDVLIGTYALAGRGPNR